MFGLGLASSMGLSDEGVGRDCVSASSSMRLLVVLLVTMLSAAEGLYGLESTGGSFSTEPLNFLFSIMSLRRSSRLGLASPPANGGWVSAP